MIFLFPTVVYMYLFKTGSVVSLVWLHRKSSLRQGARHPYLQEIPDVATPMVLVPHHPWSRYCYYLGLFFPKQTKSRAVETRRKKFTLKIFEMISETWNGFWFRWLEDGLDDLFKRLIAVMFLNVDVKHPKRMHQICRLRWKSLFSFWLILLDKALLGKCSND